MKIAENTIFCQALEPEYIAVDFFGKWIPALSHTSRPNDQRGTHGKTFLYRDFQSRTLSISFFSFNVRRSQGSLESVWR
jgi:hypothetical protein